MKGTCLRRLARVRPAIQLGVLAVVLAPLWWPRVGPGPSFYQGNFASGRLQIGSWWIPMSDPFTALSCAVSSRTTPFVLLFGAGLILGLYLLVRARIFCSFACPIHLVLEVWDRLLVRWKIRGEKIGAAWPWWTNGLIAALLVLGSAIVGMPLYEPVNPINTLVRSAQHLAVGGLGLVGAVMLFDAWAGRRVFCRHVCPVGGFYGMVNRLGVAGVAVDPQTCTGCRRCLAHCLAAPELEAAIMAARKSVSADPQGIESSHCTVCLDCAARCECNGIVFHKRWTGKTGWLMTKKKSHVQHSTLNVQRTRRLDVEGWALHVERSGRSRERTPRQLDAPRAHEPTLTRPSAFAKPTADKSGAFAPTGGEGRDEGAAFMGSLSDFKTAHRDREPIVGRAALLRRLQPKASAARQRSPTFKFIETNSLVQAQGERLLRRLWSIVLAVPLLAGCGDRKAKLEDQRILAEFRGAHYIAVADRRPSPGGPPLVPHVVYRENFNCLVCHAHQEFVFRGQLVPNCPHPERKACLQCHVSLQSDEQPFRFEMLGQGQLVSAAITTEKQP